MIIYNVTVKIEQEVRDEWLKWMQDVHIPDVLETGKFRDHKLMRVLGMDETDGITYAIHYECGSLEDFENYQRHFAPKLQQEHTEKFKNKFVAFRTLMEVV